MSLSKAEGEVGKLKNQAIAVAIKFKSLEEAIKKANDELIASHQELNTTYWNLTKVNQELSQVNEALVKSKVTAMEKFKLSIDYSVETVSFFLDNCKELKKRVMKYYPDIVDVVRKWEGKNEKVMALATVQLMDVDDSTTEDDQVSEANITIAVEIALSAAQDTIMDDAPATTTPSTYIEDDQVYRVTLEAGDVPLA